MRGRRISVRVFRHGEKAGENLTPKGFIQAAEIGARVGEEVTGRFGLRRAIIKPRASDVERTQQMRDTIVAALPKKGTRIYLLKPKTTKEIGIPKVLRNKAARDALITELGQAKFIEAYLAGKIPSEIMEPPAETAKRMRKQYIGLPKRIARRYPKGVPITIINVTHEGFPETLIMQITRKTINELGGTFKVGEEAKFEFAGQKGTLIFRGKKYPI